MSGLTVDGEETAQSIGATSISTGSKYFGVGGDIPFLGGNPFIKSNNEKAMFGMLIVGLLAAFVVYKKVK